MMNPQLSLFDYRPPTAKQAAMRRVERHADSEWKLVALECVRSVCQRLDEFTSDDIADELQKHPEAQTHTTRALGPVMVQAAHEGLCYRTDRVRNSKRDELHGQRLSVWRSRTGG